MPGKNHPNVRFQPRQAVGPASSPRSPGRVSPSPVIRRAPHVKTVACDGGARVFDPDTVRERYLNETGLFAWARLDGRPVAAIADELAGEFDGSDRTSVTADLEALFGDLLAHGLAEPAEPVAEPGAPASFPDQGSGPRELDLSLTGKCNLSCAYCFYADEMHGRNDLPAEEWLRLFAELDTLPVESLCLSGGEVFVRRDLWDLIDGLIARRMRFSILSNGTLISDRVVAALCEPGRRRRLSSIQVSIDGSCAEVHDASRGRGSFDKALRGLCRLKEAGLPVTVRVTVNQHNVDDLPAIARLLLEEVDLPAFSTNDAMPMGAGCANQGDISLTPEQRVSATTTLRSLAARYEGRITAQAGPLANARMWAEMDHARATGEPAAGWKMGFLSACGCVFSKLAVHHDGTIVPCNMLPSLHLGRINRDPIGAIWRNHPTLEALKQRRSIPMSAVQGCDTCEWNAFCNGSCPGLAMQVTGDFNRANPHDCRRSFLSEGEAAPGAARGGSK